MENTAKLLIEKINSLGKDKVSIAVDGFCGSGKTTLCEMLAKEIDANLVHIDNFYLPFDKRLPNWREVSGGNMDFEKFKTEIMDKFHTGEGFDFDSFSHVGGPHFEHYTYPQKNILIVDGSYSHFPTVSGEYDIKVFLKCSSEKQLSRLAKREGDNIDGFKTMWIPKEQKYFGEFDIENGADIVIDTTDMF